MLQNLMGEEGKRRKQRDSFDISWKGTDMIQPDPDLNLHSQTMWVIHESAPETSRNK
jgi:hypothetical protein